MRPTLLQVYNDPLAIIEALDAAGLENARPKVMAMLRDLCEYWSVDRYRERIVRDRNYVLLSESRRKKQLDYTEDKETLVREFKQVKEYDRMLIRYRGLQRQVGRKLEKRIAKWPDLDIDPSVLRKKPDPDLISRTLKRRMRRGRRTRKYLG